MMQTRIIIENPWWMVVDKPAGKLVEWHPRFPSVQAELEAWLRARSTREPFVGVVHRLDRPVGGVLLLALRKQALKQLNEQFSQRLVRKVYRARVEGLLPEAEGVLRHTLHTDPKARLARIVTEGHPKGKLAVLGYRVLQVDEGITELELYPEQGRFHQIRAQLAAVGCPIAGDEHYGARTPYLPDAIALQSWELHFNDPRTGERVAVKKSSP
jgi:23S rRNA pseudouridine1911/1915/1917 synthase